SDAMLRLLVRHAQLTGKDYTRALINSQVVPSYDETILSAVAEYRALMDRHSPVVPGALSDPRYPVEKYSFITLDGFINAKVIVEGLRRAAPNPTRLGFRQALESLKNLDLGIGAPLTFTRERHQGLDAVYFTRIQNERWVPVTDWNSAVAA